MSPIDPAKSLVPLSVRKVFRKGHRRWVLRRGLKRFQQQAGSGVVPAAELGGLIYGWGNEGWSASTIFAEACCREAQAARGPILECGSGLSTLLMGIMTQQKRTPLHALEHSQSWAQKIRVELRQLGLNHVTVHDAPLRSYGEYSWYDLERCGVSQQSFALAVCDGPPGDTPGGRYGLLPQVSPQLEDGSVILMDDLNRPCEQATLERWSREQSLAVEVVGKGKPYARIVCLGQARTDPPLTSRL